MQYDDTNRGVLFRNDKTKETQPDYTGKINVDGTEKRISAWLKQSKSGTPFLSIAVSDPMPQQETPPPQPQVKDLTDDAIPF